MRLRVAGGHRLQAAVDHVADLEEKLAQLERQVDKDLLLDFHQGFFVRQLQRHRYRFVEFAQLFDDFFHGLDLQLKGGRGRRRGYAGESTSPPVSVPVPTRPLGLRL